MILKKDIVIPAGTALKESPRLTRRQGRNHWACDIGLSNNTSGVFTYCIDSDAEIMSEWFKEDKK